MPSGLYPYDLRAVTPTEDTQSSSRFLSPRIADSCMSDSSHKKTPPKKLKVLESMDAFNADYRRRIREQTRIPSSTPESSQIGMSASRSALVVLDDDSSNNSAASRTPNTKAFKPYPWEASGGRPSVMPPGASSAVNTRPLSDEVIGGLTDKDVQMSRTVVLAHSARHSKKGHLANVSMQTALRRAILICRHQMVTLVPQPAVEDSPVVAKKARAPKSQVSKGTSRALRALPSWAQPIVFKQIIPSLIKHYGARDDPWDLDGPLGTNHFKTVLNAILDTVHSDEEHDVGPGENLWRFVGPCCLRASNSTDHLQSRQQVYDWRSNFGKIAIKMVKEHMEAYRRAYGPDATAGWIANALAKGGRATYSTPNLEVCTLIDCV